MKTLPRRSGVGGIDYKITKAKRFISRYREEEIAELFNQESSRNPASGSKKPHQD